MNNFAKISGAVTLAALLYGDPWLGTLAALGAVTSTATAHVCKLDTGATSAGLMGYNGCLVGCAFSVFLGQPAAELFSPLTPPPPPVNPRDELQNALMGLWLADGPVAREHARTALAAGRES